MLALRKWLFSGLLVIVPLFITLAVLKWIIDTLDQTLWVLPGAWQRWLYDNNVRGLGVLLTLADRAGGGRHCQQLRGQAPAGLGQRRGAPHSGRALDLFERQAGVGHAVLRKRQCFPHGGAGAVAA
jgi:hypothetical protein